MLKVCQMIFMVFLSTFTVVEAKSILNIHFHDILCCRALILYSIQHSCSTRSLLPALTYNQKNSNPHLKVFPKIDYIQQPQFFQKYVCTYESPCVLNRPASLKI